MTNEFANLNIYKSHSLNDVKRFMSLASEADPVAATYDFLGTNDLSHAHTWEHEHFDYVINEYGFREVSNPMDVDIAAFGCSFTFGSGLPQDKLWHKILANRLNTTSYNFGAPSKSIESIIDLFLIVSNHIKINKAVILLPSFVRKQIAKTHPDTNDTINYVDTALGFDFSSVKNYGIDNDLLYRAIPNEELYKLTRNKIYLLDHFAKVRQIKVFLSSWEQDTYEFICSMNLEHVVLLPQWKSPSMEFAKQDLARDNLHPGIKHHELFADAIYDYVK